MKNIAGNVWEWTSDWWQVDHSKNKILDPVIFKFEKSSKF
jgi:formylglycine-generating enzyme required for sulfatase activity